MGLVDLNSDIPQQHLVVKSGTDLGLVELSSDLPPAASSGEEWY